MVHLLLRELALTEMVMVHLELMADQVEKVLLIIAADDSAAVVQVRIQGPVAEPAVVRFV